MAAGWHRALTIGRQEQGMHAAVDGKCGPPCCLDGNDSDPITLLSSLSSCEVLTILWTSLRPHSSPSACCPVPPILLPFTSFRSCFGAYPRAGGRPSASAPRTAPTSLACSFCLRRGTPSSSRRPWTTRCSCMSLNAPRWSPGWQAGPAGQREPAAAAAAGPSLHRHDPLAPFIATPTASRLGFTLWVSGSVAG